MTHKPIGDSAQDFGSTSPYTGSVGTTPILVPSVAGDPISLLLVRCKNQTPNTKILQWSVDGVTYHDLAPGEYVGWPPKGNLTQIYLKGTVASVEYEVILNREPT